MAFDEVLSEMEARDAKDLERDWGKLVKVEDAVRIDSTCMSVEQVCPVSYTHLDVYKRQHHPLDSQISKGASGFY